MSLHDLAKPKPDKVPPGWKTSIQWADEDGFSHSYTRQLLSRAVADGTIEMKKFRISNGNMLFPTPHYREKSKRSKR